MHLHGHNNVFFTVYAKPRQ